MTTAIKTPAGKYPPGYESNHLTFEQAVGVLECLHNYKRLARNYIWTRDHQEILESTAGGLTRRTLEECLGFRLYTQKVAELEKRGLVAVDRDTWHQRKTGSISVRIFRLTPAGSYYLAGYRGLLPPPLSKNKAAR